MKSKMVALLLFMALLTGCSAQKEVVPVVSKPDITKLLVEPPASAMIPAHKPVPMTKGATNAANSVVVRNNNLMCVDDRQKLTTLQRYVLGLFPDKK